MSKKVYKYNKEYQHKYYITHRGAFAKKQACRIQDPEVKELMNIQTKASKMRYRNQALDILGGVCVQCGYSDRRALQIDHINGNGKKERETLSAWGLYKKIISGDTDNYQLLCANCNCIKRFERGEYTSGGNIKARRAAYGVKTA